MRIIFTNSTTAIEYFYLLKDDLYLPRLLQHDSDNKCLSLQEFFSPPASMYMSMKSLQDNGLHWTENTPKELEAATKEILSRTGNRFSSTISDDLQKRFDTLVETCGLKYGGRLVKAFAPMSRLFLEQHRDLL